MKNDRRPIDFELSASLQDILNRPKVRSKLLQASLFITAFEMLKNSVTDFVQDHFESGRGSNGKRKLSPKYNDDVLKPFKNEQGGVDTFKACVQWLAQQGVIQNTDIDTISKIRRHRNEIAHQLPDIVFYHSQRVDLGLFRKLKSIFHRIEDHRARIDVEVANAVEGNPPLPETAHIYSGPEIILELIAKSVAEESIS